MTTPNYTIIRETLMAQQTAKGLVTRKTFNTIANEVVGKWAIMIQLLNGKIGVGINEDKNKALELAITKAKSL